MQAIYVCAVRTVFAAFLLAAAAGCAPKDKAAPSASQEQSAETTDELVVVGLLDAGEPANLPEGAVARLDLRNDARQDAGAETLTSAQFTIPSLPAPFSLSVARERIADAAELSVFAQIFAGDELLYVTASHVAVDPDTDNSNISAALTSVAEFNKPDPAPGTGFGGMMITPPQTAYNCAGESLLVALEAGAAFVTFADKSSLRLPLISGEAPEKIFSNGRATLFVETGDDGSNGLSFSRGRAASAACTPM